MPSATAITICSAFSPDRPAERAGHRRCAHRRGLSRRSAAAPRLACAATIAPSSNWAPNYRGKSVIVVCQSGQKLSEGTAAWLRHEGIDAQTLEGGFEAWKKAGELLVRTDKLPPRDEQGRTVWVTRSRPKVDRIACPWLIRRFIDPNAVFLFVAAVRGHRCGRALQAPRPSTSRACSGATAATPAPSTR